MKENKSKNLQVEDVPSFSEIKNRDSTVFICSLGTKKVGSISATLVGINTYSVGGFFVDPSQRGHHVGSELLKLVNKFLERNNSLGKLVNTIRGDAAGTYESNGWKKGEFKSQDAYGGYEYTYDARK